ncbi:MAG: acyl-CoA reductase, partial [Flavobacteriales bacterium]|nr:acyl-CoA reductase [Flavobacteriales bacterium]
MSLQQRISTFVQLGKIFKHLGENKAWSGFDLGISESEYQRFESSFQYAKAKNPWFTEENVRQALLGLAHMLSQEKLEQWTSAYQLPTEFTGKKVGVIMAGNIPLVGFHDMLCVLLAGHNLLIKLSSDDEILPKEVINTLSLLDGAMASRVQLVEHKLEGFDAVIATGSNNSARYFHYYFDHVPHLIRKNRNSIAVLTGDESTEELKALGHDLFSFFGLGCRSITKLFVPEGYKLDTLFEALYDRHEIANHNKYANNYDYHKAVWLLNQEQLLDNGFLLLKRDDNICSPTGTLFYDFYESKAEVETYLEERKEEIQC